MIGHGLPSAQVAQLVEHFHGKEGVTSSSLVLGLDCHGGAPLSVALLLRWCLVAKHFVRYGGKMEAVRKRWTDERLDDLNHRVDDGFRRVEDDLRAHRVETKTALISLRAEMNERFDKVEARSDKKFDKIDARFDRVDEKFDKLDARFDRLSRLIIQIGGGAIATLVAYSILSHL
jgi:hypothetical protein